jgi:hypothetical protein
METLRLITFNSFNNLIKDTDLNALDKEQDVFDRLDDDVTSLMVRA